MVTVAEWFRVRPYEVHIMIVMDTSYLSGLLHSHWGNRTTAHWGNMTIALVRVATELAEKDSWTFPWLFPNTWWRRQMETFSALLALCEGNSLSPVNSPHKGQWCEALIFSLICAWTNSWANNRDAGDLRPHHAHSDVSVMCPAQNPVTLPTYSQRWLFCKIYSQPIFTTTSK